MPHSPVQATRGCRVLAVQQALFQALFQAPGVLRCTASQPATHVLTAVSF